jgi:ureidoglycolate lyase
MGRTQRVKMELLTEEAFAPFGEVIAARTHSPDAPMGGVSRGWTVDFQTDGTPRVQVTQTPHTGFTFTKLERHFMHTKVCVPLVGSPAVVAVAAPTDPNDPDAIPPPEEVRAFLLDGTKGYMFKRGTWHSVDRLPLYPPGTVFVVFNDRETAADLKLGYEGKGGFKLTQEVDYEKQYGISFEIVL